MSNFFGSWNHYPLWWTFFTPMRKSLKRFHSTTFLKVKFDQESRTTKCPQRIHEKRNLLTRNHKAKNLVQNLHHMKTWCYESVSRPPSELWWSDDEKIKGLMSLMSLWIGSIGNEYKTSICDKKKQEKEKWIWFHLNSGFLCIMSRDW